MRKTAWPERLRCLLPRSIADDAYQPSIADLRISFALGEIGKLSFAMAVAWTFVECMRLALLWRITRRRSSVHTRREYLAMLLQDVRRALRVFKLEPGFAAAAVVTLALGIGANTALFAVVEAVLLRPLPYAGADDLVLLKHRSRETGISKEDLAIGDFVDLRERQQSLEKLIGYGGVETTITGAGEPLRVRGLGATPELFDALRVTPAMGRLFTADDMRQGAPPVVMISYELWQTQFGSDPEILSRSISAGTSRRMVVGVAPPGFHFPPDSPTSLIVPLPVPETAPAQRRAGWIYGLGRLRPGQTLDTARAEFASLAAQLEQEYPEQNRGTTYDVLPLRDALVGDTKRPLLLLLGAVGFVLLIACANVGNLLLALAWILPERWPPTDEGRPRRALAQLAVTNGQPDGTSGALAHFRHHPPLARRTESAFRR